jgi:Mycothiol maleylpyruvate isomerase N-terminal domain
MPDSRAERAAKIDTGDLYEQTRAHFVETVFALPEASLHLRVAATPAWSVRDVLAHVVGLVADLNAQRFPAPDDDSGRAWTDGQVARGRGRSIRDVVSEWDREAPIFEEGLRTFGYEMGSHFVADLHAHYQDVRGAIGEPAEADGLTVRVALDHYAGFMNQMLGDAKWGTLEIVAAGETERLGGAGEHRAKVSGPPFELLRSLAGRRSAAQIRALDWEGDIDAFLDWLQAGFSGGYALPTADLIE